MVRASSVSVRVLIAGILDELADAEARILVERGKAAAALGQSLAGELQACVREALGRAL